MLWFRVLAEDSGMADLIRARGQLPDLPADAPKALRVICEHIAKLDDKAISDAAIGHPGSLREVRVLVEMLLEGYRLMTVEPNPPPKAMGVLQVQDRGRVALLSIPSVRNRVLQRFESATNDLRKLDVEKLDEIKKAALYARISETGLAWMWALDEEAVQSLSNMARGVESILQTLLRYNSTVASLLRKEFSTIQ
jgi:hypothetical protein